MLALLQRVTHANVMVNAKEIGAIKQGILVFKRHAPQFYPSSATRAG